MKEKTALVCGAGGFIGSHLVKFLKGQGYYVVGADLHFPFFAPTLADDFFLSDLSIPSEVNDILSAEYFDEIYQLAADMGGAGFVFTGQHDADILSNNALINLNVLHTITAQKAKPKIFFSSSACIYPAYNQKDPHNPKCSEDSAYPADPDSDYGFEKLFSERLYLAYHRNAGVNIRIARFHNIFGPEGTWEGGREKAPAAICRKVAEAPDGGKIEIWGDGAQTRSFLYIDACLEGVSRLMASDFTEPLNIGSEEMVSINELARMIIEISGKHLEIVHTEGPLGVRGRNSDNHLIKEKLGWAPTAILYDGLVKTYRWVAEKVKEKKEESFQIES